MNVAGHVLRIRPASGSEGPDGVRGGTNSDKSRRASPRRRGVALNVVAAGVALAGAVGCQGPSGGRTDLQALKVTKIRPSVEFTGRVREQEQRSKVGAGTTRSKESVFEESARLETEGSVYHPNLLEFSLAGLFGLQQADFSEKFSGRERHSSDDTEVYEFDFEGRLLKKKSYPGTVYARRYRSLEARPFLSSLETTTSNYGFNWQYVDPKMPTNLQFNHTEVLLRPLDPSEGDGQQLNTNLRFETAYKFSDTNVLSFTYDHQSVDEKPFELDYVSDELTLRHRWDFGEGRGHRLESELNYFKQVGTYDVERFRWRETLRLRHSESLRSWYQYEFLDRTQGTLAGVPPIGERSSSFSATLEHRWYESLISQITGFGHLQDFDSSLDIRRFGVQPGFDYRKKNPWGVLLAGYRFRLQSEDRNGGDQSLEVLDERRTFVDPDPIVLSSGNVAIGTIRITAEDRLTIYRAGEDYRVRQVGDTVEIERVPTGRIRDGQTVLVDYVFSVAGDFTLDTINHEANVRQDFSFGLSPYYRLRIQDQEISPDDATGITPENIEAHIVGAEFARGPVRASAEYEDHDSTVSPFRALRLNAEISRRFDFGATASLKSRWSEIRRSGELDRLTRFFTVEGRLRQRLPNGLTVEGSVLHRREQDSESGDDEGVDVDFALEWIVRETEVRLTYEFGRFDDDFSNNRNESLFVQVRRRF